MIIVSSHGRLRTTFAALLSGTALLAAALPAGAEGEGFSITVNGAPLGAPEEARAAANAPVAAPVLADLALEQADIRVSYDGLFVSRRLNVLTADLRDAFRGGETVRFRNSTNYAGAVARAELRLTPAAQGLGAPKTVVVPVAPEGEAGWVMPADGPDLWSYTLRVYDAQGRFDETAPRQIARSETPADPVLNGPVAAAGEGEDNTATRNIPATGGLVTVSGAGLPEGARVTVMGAPVPVDAGGGFVTQRLLPAGEHDVAVSLAAPGRRGLTLEREVVIPRSDWFYAGIADLTVSRRGESLSDAETKTEGRLAFYAKGLIDGRTRVTASVDTEEREIEHLFDDFFDKSPTSVLDRLDPSDLYPTYGDDSTVVEDAPTSGRLYVKVERGDSHLMWGDFRNRIEGTRYLNTSRNLYGAQLVYRSPEVTAEGERRHEAMLYAASPDSLPQRDELRGTGGSAYFLKRQDVLPGTETVAVEVVDRTTGRVVSRRLLAAARDYRIDYLQGTIILDEPLSSSTSDGSVVSGGAAGDYDVNLVVQYEYTPTLTDVDGTAFGGRVETWLPGERVRLGFTGMDETTDEADLRVIGADARLVIGANSHIEAEIAESRGTGFGRSVSTDGGLSFTDIPAGGAAVTAQAMRIEGVLDLADVAPGREGTLSAFYETKEAGFVTLSEDVDADQQIWGVAAEVRIGPASEFRLRYKDFDEDGGERLREGTAELAFALSPVWTAEVGLRHLDAVEPGDPDDTGRRTDAGVRFTRALGGDNEVYVFGQATLDRAGGLDRNDRAGVGGTVQLSGRLSASGEVSEGTSGMGARARLDYRPSAESRYYLGYTLDPDREVAGHTLNGRDQGGLVVGAERTLGSATIFAENNYDMWGRRRSLTSAYGVSYTPSDIWSWSAGLETGRVHDPMDGDFDRTALSLGTRYDNGAGVSARLRGEFRVEDHETDPSRDRETYALTGRYGYQVSDDWRFVAAGDVLISESDQSDFLDGRYAEASFGFAYRPVENDRLNALFRYTFLYDMPGADQVSSDGSSAGDRQRSHILSADAIWELNASWEIGGKLAYRKSETAPRVGGGFADNSATLAAVRAIYKLPHEWEAMGELRVLDLPSNDAREYGALAAVWRQVHPNAKLGLGYNFGSFSDDLRDVTLDDRGMFLNLVASF